VRPRSAGVRANSSPSCCAVAAYYPRSAACDSRLLAPTTLLPALPCPALQPDAEPLPSAALAVGAFAGTALVTLVLALCARLGLRSAAVLLLRQPDVLVQPLAAAIRKLTSIHALAGALPLLMPAARWTLAALALVGGRASHAIASELLQGIAAPTPGLAHTALADGAACVLLLLAALAGCAALFGAGLVALLHASMDGLPSMHGRRRERRNHALWLAASIAAAAAGAAAVVVSSSSLLAE